MDKNAMKKYAVWARTELIDRVRQRAVRYEVTAYANLNADSASGKVLTDIEKTQRQAAIARMRDKGNEYVIEEVAYTWFNRFAALRYMEVNNYLPSRVRVFTDERGSFKPQILAEAIHLTLDGLDMEKVYALKEQENNDELYKYLLITQCNALSAVLPQMFKPVDEKCKEEKNDYTILLFPDNLLREGSVVEQMVTLISEDNWLDAVQIIGWLYQYYNIEPKAKVFGRASGTKIQKEDIPAATQLFTPDWIVRYMVENSLGRLWLEGHSQNAEQLLPTEEEQAAYIAGERSTEDSKWHYYLKKAEQEEDVQVQLAEIRKEYATLKPEEILCIDPCMGSGHILTYLFDTLMKIYAAYGHSTRESVQSIIEHNLYGLDIDDRAAQLAYFEVMMKAVKYDPRFLKRKNEGGKPAAPQPHVYAIQESNHIQYEQEYGDFLLSEEHRDTLKYLLETFQDAKEYGSILQVEKRDYTGFLKAWELCADASLENIVMIGWYTAANERVQALALQAIALSQKYDVTVTNPPYMAISSASALLNDYVNKNYLGGKTDLFAAFIEKCLQMTKHRRFTAMITQQSWMFLTSFEKLRKRIINYDISSMAHMGARGFDEINGEVVQTVAFVMRRENTNGNYKGTFSRLIEGANEKEKEMMFLSGCYQYVSRSSNFSKTPQLLIAYWVSDKTIACFEQDTLDKVLITREGMATADNERFLRLWHEVFIDNIAFHVKDNNDAVSRAIKWVPYNKGGTTRDWYGNNDYVVDWENDGLAIRNNKDPKTGRTRSHNYNGEFGFKEGLTWSAISSGDLSVRYCSKGFLFDSKGAKGFAKDRINIYWILGLLNSKVAMQFLQFLSPTLDFKVGDVISIPYIYSENEFEKVTVLVEDIVSSSKTEWDSFENSWDFRKHPLIAVIPENHMLFDDVSNIDLAECFMVWEKDCEKRFNKLKANEEELNRIFIDIYGLQDELTPDVEDKDITVRKADLQRDIKSLISYAVGCSFGRYSLDTDGLVYAGGEWNDTKYQPFPADKDNIIPICDDDYFEDDITGLFVKFIETAYGKDTLDVNLRYIADALGGKGTPKEVIRNYFLNDFFADHCNMYSVTGSGKRPIYWLFDSGRKNGFKALVYMHRCQPDTIARMRTDYVHEQQSRYRTAIADLGNRIADASASERVSLNKQLSKLQDQSEEIRKYEEKIHHLADQFIAIDLDDGVKVNYAKFQDVLAKIK